MGVPRFGCRAALVLGALIALQTRLAAQATIPPHSLSGLLDDLTRKTTAFVSGVPPADVPESARDNPLGVLTGLKVATTPLGTSTGGFTFTFDSRHRHVHTHIPELRAGVREAEPHDW